MAILSSACGAAVSVAAGVVSHFAQPRVTNLADDSIFFLMLGGLAVVPLRASRLGAFECFVSALAVTLVSAPVVVGGFLYLAGGCLAINAAPLTQSGCTGSNWAFPIFGVLAWCLVIGPLLTFLAALISGTSLLFNKWHSRRVKSSGADHSGRTESSV
ncbi:MAG: hypothetical protein ACR2GA_07185 [Chloroflexota bacterium]